MFAIIGGLGMQELIIVLIILLLLFGSTRLPQLAKGMGKSIREFKKGVADGGDDDDAELEAARRERLRAADSNRLREDELASSDKYSTKPR
jgi:sec-independent protein translocase protein TatA